MTMHKSTSNVIFLRMKTLLVRLVMLTSLLHLLWVLHCETSFRKEILQETVTLRRVLTIWNHTNILKIFKRNALCFRWGEPMFAKTSSWRKIGFVRNCRPHSPAICRYQTSRRLRSKLSKNWQRSSLPSNLIFPVKILTEIIPEKRRNLSSFDLFVLTIQCRTPQLYEMKWGNPWILQQ